MGDMAEDFKALREYKREKRANNREDSTSILTHNGISFESKNNGAHLIINHFNQVVDFWPGTGKYIFRHKNIKGRGIYNLLKHLEVV